MRIWVFRFKLFWHLLFRNLVSGDSVLGLMWRIVIALLAILGVTMLNQLVSIHISVPALKWEVVDRSVTLGLVLLWCLGIIVVILAIGSAWTRTHWMAPRLKLVHDPECVGCLFDFKDGRRRLRVGVKNLGSESIDGVTIYLTSLEPRPELFDRACPLSIWNGQGQGYTSISITLHPTEPNHHHAEFAFYSNGQLQISPAAYGPLLIPIQNYTGIFSVEGKSVPAHIFQFSLSSDAVTDPRPTLVLQPRNKLSPWFLGRRKKLQQHV